MEIEYPDRDAALAAYAEAMEIRFEQARDALLKDAQLESALARPRNAATYEGADLARQAATLFWGMLVRIVPRPPRAHRAAAQIRPLAKVRTRAAGSGRGTPRVSLP